MHRKEEPKMNYNGKNLCLALHVCNLTSFARLEANNTQRAGPRGSDRHHVDCDAGRWPVMMALQ